MHQPQQHALAGTIWPHDSCEAAAVKCEVHSIDQSAPSNLERKVTHLQGQEALRRSGAL